MSTEDTRPYYKGPASVVLGDGSVVRVTAVIFDRQLAGGEPMWGADLTPAVDAEPAGSLASVAQAGAGQLRVRGARGTFRVHAYDADAEKILLRGVGEPPQWPKSDHHAA